LRPQIEESRRIEEFAREQTKLLGHELTPFETGAIDTARLARCKKCQMVVALDMMIPALSLTDISARCRRSNLEPSKEIQA
jgi:hypothetical protein